MNISAEAIVGLVVGLIVGIFGAYRVVITMREQIKTLFNKIAEIKKEKDDDINKLESKLTKQDEKFEKVFSKFDDLKDDMHAVRDSHIEAIKNLSDLMNTRHIELITKLSEKQQ